MSKPLISIIIPVLNGYDFLDYCFLNLKKQIYPRLEIIFVDNGSSDGSLEKINQYCSNYSNYHVLNCSTPGPGAARNKGINSAIGDYISFLDVDDELAPDKHNTLFDQIKRFPDAAMVVGRTKKKYTDDREEIMNLGTLSLGINNPPTPGLLWLKQFQHHPHISSTLIKKEYITAKSPFPENLLFGEDIAFSVKIGINNQVVFVDELVSIYNRHEKSAVSTSNKEITPTERYFQFYRNFALPYFYTKKESEPFSLAYNICEKSAYKLLMKLIKVENNSAYNNVFQELKNNSILKKSISRSLLFSIFPYNIANYFNQKIN
jgi:glycosyltransferase involved in cell wall biosynthesis